MANAGYQPSYASGNSWNTPAASAPPVAGPSASPYQQGDEARLQAQLDNDPKYRALLTKYQATKAPLDWAALTEYANRALNAGVNNSRTAAVQIDGQGKVQLQNRDNKWTSPATWGPIAVGAAGGWAALASHGGAAAPLASTQVGTGFVGPIEGGTGLATGAGGAGAAGAGAAGAGAAADVLPSAGYSWANGALPGYNTVPNATRLVTAGTSGLSSGAGAGAGGGAATTAAGLLTKGDYAGIGVNAAGSALSSYFGAKNENEQKQQDRQTQLDLQHNALEASQAANTQSLAQRESELDPFRHQMDQAADIGKLDRLERASYKPVSVSMPAGSPYAKYMPQTSGGYSYEKSPELIASASTLKKNVMAGNGAPSMTNPDNYGKTGAVDIFGVMAGKKDPTSSASFASGTPAPASSVGADPLGAMIRSGYQSALGRPASDSDIRGILGELSRVYGRQLTAADSALVQNWIQKNLRTSPEAQQRQSGGYQPSYAGMNG